MGCLAPPSARGPASPGRQPLRWMAGVRPSAEPSELNDRHVLGVGGRAGGVLLKRRGLHSRRASTPRAVGPSVLFCVARRRPSPATRLADNAFTPTVHVRVVRWWREKNRTRQAHTPPPPSNQLSFLSLFINFYQVL